MQGFLISETATSSLSQSQRLPDCSRCGLRDKCETPMMAVEGEGRRGILFVLESPSLQDNQAGLLLTGVKGSFLETKLKAIGLDLWEDCWVTSAVACYPHKGAPEIKHVECCRPHLFRTIKSLKPAVIVPLGNASIRAMFSHRVKQDANARIWRGYTIPDVSCTRAWACPMCDLDFIMNDEKYGEVAEVLFEHDLQGMMNCLNTKLPAPLPVEDCVIDKRKAFVLADMVLDRLDVAPCLIAVDYETNMLKPHDAQSKIKTVSFCIDGLPPFAYEIKNEDDKNITKDILSHPNAHLVAANMLFEIGWTRAWLDEHECNWGWDTVLAAHVLDNRRKVTSTKFQAFANFGLEQYDRHLGSLLEGKTGYEENKIDEIPIEQLLKYNAIDSQVELFLAKKQMKELGHGIG